MILDAGSSDGTREILKEIASTDYRFKIFFKKMNLSNSLNFLIKISNTNYIFRFDADDIMNRFRIEKQLKYLLKGYDIVGSNVLVKKKYFFYTRKYPEKTTGIAYYSLIKNPFAHPSIAFKKNKVYKYKDLLAMEDYNLWADCITKKLKTINIQENLTVYRIHNYNKSKDVLNINHRKIREKICKKLIKYLNISNKFYNIVLNLNSLKKVELKNIEPFILIINNNNKISKNDKYLIFKQIILNSVIYSFFDILIFNKLKIYFKDKIKLFFLMHLYQIIKK